MSQIPLDLTQSASFAEEDYIVSDCNADAHRLVTSWPDWPGHCVAVVGDTSSGKTHLAHIWCHRAGGSFYDVTSDAAEQGLDISGNICVEISDSAKFDEEKLLHIFNWTRENSHSLLLTAEKPPTHWPVTLPDLRSRLTLPVCAEIEQPDDQFMHIFLGKLFSDQQIAYDPDVAHYLLSRIERRYVALRAAARGILERAWSEKRRITIPLVRAFLRDRRDM